MPDRLWKHTIPPASFDPRPEPEYRRGPLHEGAEAGTWYSDSEAARLIDVDDPQVRKRIYRCLPNTLSEALCWHIADAIIAALNDTGGAIDRLNP